MTLLWFKIFMIKVQYETGQKKDESDKLGKVSCDYISTKIFKIK